MLVNEAGSGKKGWTARAGGAFLMLAFLADSFSGV
jgi:hypothetical protein